MRRLIAVAVVAVAAFAPMNAFAYDRACGGILDTECHGVTCPMDCFDHDCLVWLDPMHSPRTAQCLL